MARASKPRAKTLKTILTTALVRSVHAKTTNLRSNSTASS